MRKILFTSISIFVATIIHAQQRPCAGSPVYRQFDFWIGQWDVYALNGKKAGDSKVSLILDSCIILEEWTSTSQLNGLTYMGKSFNTFNSSSGQWQQTWVDNSGGTIEFLKGKYGDNKMVFQTYPFNFNADTIAIRRLTFFNLGSDEVRQLGEISKDNGTTWSTEYDLDYKRKK